MVCSGRDGLFSLGSFSFNCGHTLENAEIAYRVFGELAPDRSNLVLYPSSYGAWPEDIDWVIGPILDPARWCVVLVSQFGNGRSSSPSTSAMGLAEDGWVLSHADNVRAQRRLLEEAFGVESPALIYGWSMGAQQAHHWAVSHPEMVERICCVCGTARTSPHNRLFLLSLRQALTADPHWTGSGFRGAPEQGLRTYALIYASWAASQSWFRSLEEPVEQHVEERWLPLYRRHDPRDLIAMLDTWLANDVADGGDLSQALGRIQARAAVVACDRDLYFTSEDMAAEAAAIPDADFRVLRSTLGHRAGNPHSSPPEQQWLRQIVEQLLDG